MISSGVRLVLAPGSLLAAAALATLLSGRGERWGRALGVVAAAAAAGMLASEIRVVAAQGSLDATFGTPVPGTDFLFHADSTGVVLGIMAAVAAMLALLDAEHSRGRVGAILLCAAGGCGAAVGGNVVMLVAGLEAASVGALLLMPRGRRVSRGAGLTYALMLLASLGLVGAAAELTVSVGTSDLGAVEVGAVTAAVAIPWALAGAAALIAPALAPSGAGLGWAAIGAIPCGAAVLLRLRGLAGTLPLSVIVVLAVAGSLVALWGALVAGRARGEPATTGRGLLLILAGIAISVVGISAEAGGTATAAALVALELSAAASPLWSATPSSQTRRRLGALALLVAGNLPLGFGLSAAILAAGAAVSLGLAGGALTLAICASAVVGAAGSIAAAHQLVRVGGLDGGSPISPLSGAALGASLVAGLIPGVVGAWVVSPLSPARFAVSADAAVVRVPQGGWAGGYVLVAATWLAVVATAGSVLAGRTPATLAREAPRADPPRAAWVGALSLWRPLRRPVALALGGAGSLDRWLLSQPKLPMVLVAALLAVFFLH